MHLMLVLLFVALWFILRSYLFLCLTLCYFVLVFFSPFSIAITSLGEERERERANRSAFRTFVRFAVRDCDTPRVFSFLLLCVSSSY